MNYKFVPDVKEISYNGETFCIHKDLTICGSNYKLIHELQEAFMDTLGIKLKLQVAESHEHVLWIGRKGESLATAFPSHEQGYIVNIGADHVWLKASSEQGLFYGIQTFRQILRQSDGDILQGLFITDAPALNYRGLQLDVSRGKVFTIETVKEIIDLIAGYKMNVLQLYIEHTFAFEKHSSFSKDVGAITPEFIRQIQEYCKSKYVELQANLQSFGHCNRILTQPEYRELSESDLYWTLSPSKDETYEFLGDLYEEYLPLFESSVVNIGCDETYDLGLGLSKKRKAQEGKGRVYLDHILKLRDLATVHGKKIMFFGDVLINHPELLTEIPKDVILLDWIYDPMDEYPNTKEFGASGRRFWVCPGTGGWNSIFPRLQGAKVNIERLVKTGLQNGAEGMLLTDWGDHGHYGVLSVNFYSYLLGAAVSWEGEAFNFDEFEEGLEAIQFQGEPWLDLYNGLASIYDLPGIWSKNRSQCVIALFDEPLFGQTVAGRIPPKTLVPLKPLPNDVLPVMEEEGHHWLRPIFQLTDEVLDSIDDRVAILQPKVNQLSNEIVRQEFQFVIDCFSVMTRKTRFGKRVRQSFAERTVNVDMILDFELEAQRLKQLYARLLIDFQHVWFARSSEAEIHISVTHFANIISRLDYVHKWLTKQRKAMNKSLFVDLDFTTYQTCGYQSLPTF